MKKNLKLALLIGFFGTILGCKKSNKEVILDGGMVNVTNAVVGAPTLNMTTTANGVVSSSNTINNNSYAIMPLVSGQVPISFGIPAVAATQYSPGVAAATYFTTTLAMDKSTNYSLFLTGSSTAAIDNVLIKENYTRTYTDSVCGVRFINLATGSNPISVDLQGNANGSEAASLAYKAYTDFKQYPAKSANTSYTFEFRDATTGNLISTYRLTTPFFHNVTLCLNGSGSRIIQDNDF